MKKKMRGLFSLDQKPHSLCCRTFSDKRQVQAITWTISARIRFLRLSLCHITCSHSYVDASKNSTLKPSSKSERLTTEAFSIRQTSLPWSVAVYTCLLLPATCYSTVALASEDQLHACGLWIHLLFTFSSYPRSIRLALIPSHRSNAKEKNLGLQEPAHESIHSPCHTDRTASTGSPSHCSYDAAAALYCSHHRCYACVPWCLPQDYNIFLAKHLESSSSLATGKWWSISLSTKAWDGSAKSKHGAYSFFLFVLY